MTSPVSDATTAADATTASDATTAADATTASDATVSGTTDASIAGDSGEDAPLDAASDGSPLAPCGASRDVFFVETLPEGGLAFQEMATNLDSNWTIQQGSPAQPFEFRIERLGPGPFATLGFPSPSGAPPPPGTYLASPNGDATTPGFQLTLGGGIWGATSGTFTVVDFTEGAGTSAGLSSYSMFFDIVSPGSTSNDEIRGCLRYARGLDPSATGTDASVAALQPDASSVTPCLAGGYVFYVEGENGYPGISGPSTLNAANGTWSAGLTSGSLLQVQVVDTGLGWVLNASAPSNQALSVGTYQAQSNAPNMGAAWIQVLAPGGGCPNGTPSGTFTISELSAQPSDQANVTKLLMSFDLTCGGQGTLRGCVSYGN